MNVIDKTILQFKGNDLSVMLYLITHADKNGVCEVSYSILSEELGLSIQSCRTALNHLKLTSKLTSKSTSKITYITICDYVSYNIEYDREQQANQQALQQAKIDELTIKADELNAKIVDLEKQLEQEKAKKAKRETMPKTIEERDQQLSVRANIFGKTLIPFLNTNGGPYTKEMIRAFYNYWTEPNKSHTKMRFEMEKTWDVGRRLETWENNNKNFKNNNNYGRETITDKIQRTVAEADEFSRKLRAKREANLGSGDSTEIR